MLNNFCLFLFLLSINSSCSQNSDNLSGCIRLESEISSDVATNTFLPPITLFIDNKGNVLEINEKIKIVDGNFMGSDTLNIFFINTKKGIFSAYKKLAINQKPYVTDNIENKQEGISFYKKNVDFFLDAKDIRITDTIIDNVKCRFAIGVKSLESSKIIYEAIVKNKPHDFPVQLSKIISKMTDGGFVEQVKIIDESNKKTLTFKCKYETNNLPDELDSIMKKWYIN